MKTFTFGFERLMGTAATARESVYHKACSPGGTATAERQGTTGRSGKTTVKRGGGGKRPWLAEHITDQRRIFPMKPA